MVVPSSEDGLPEARSIQAAGSTERRSIVRGITEMLDNIVVQIGEIQGVLAQLDEEQLED